MRSALTALLKMTTVAMVGHVAWADCPEPDGSKAAHIDPDKPDGKRPVPVDGPQRL